MQSPVSIQTKQAFLQWFIESHGEGNAELAWFMCELSEDERILSNIHFVDNIQYCPKGMILDVKDRQDISICFFKEHVQTDDVYTAYHEINLYHQEAFFIQIQFSKGSRPHLYDIVVENDQSYDYDLKKETDHLLTYLLTTGKEKYVKEEIDIALETGDKERFYFLSNMLQELRFKK